jgi:competence protein ComEC
MSIGAIPMLRPLLSLMVGIGGASVLETISSDPSLLVVGLAIASVLCIRMTRLCLARGLVIGLMYVALGSCLYQMHRQVPAAHWERSGAEEGVFVARILELVPRRSYTQMVLSVKARLNGPGPLQQTSGKALLLVRRGSEQQLPPAGSLIGFRASFRPIQEAKNPHAFDPAAYWAQKQVRKQAWMESEELVLLRRPATASLFFFRNRVLHLLGRVLPDQDQFGIAVALVLGDKAYLDKEVKSSYADSGAIHVLAVSGLHVGLVYALFYWILEKISRWLPLGRRLRLFCLLFILVAYAGFTGASPSVCRAVLMLSCWMISKALYKTTSTLNVVCVSAFILLIFNPGLLFDLGFQLSYSAVLGILFLYPLILESWSPRFQVLQYAWKLSSVSVAAQLGTLPWSLYYFHQFPTYFGLSSLLIIPLISLVLMMAFAYLLLSWEPFLSSWLGTLLQWLIEACNQIVLLIQQLPMALVEDIWIQQTDIVLYFLLLFLIIRAFWQLSYRLLIAQAVLLLIWVSLQGYESRAKQATSSLIIYHTNDFFMADWLEKGHLLSLTEPAADSLQVQYSSAGWRSYHGMEGATMNRLPEQFVRSDTALCWTFNKEQGILIGPSSRFLPPNADPQAGKILIADPDNPWVGEWLCRDSIRLLVLIPRRYQSRTWENLARQEDIPVWSIKEQGAFEYEY